MEVSSFFKRLAGLSVISSALMFSPLAMSQDTDPLASTLSDVALEVISAAEELYPGIFKNGNPFKQAQGFTYKYYASSKVYVGIKDGSIWLLGGVFGDTAANRGTFADTLYFLNEVRAKRNEAPIEVPDVDLPTGDFTLTVTGTTTTVVLGFATSVDFELILEDTPAPDADDIDEVEDAVLESLAESGVDTITDVEVVTTNNSSDRVTFTISFSTVSSTAAGDVATDYDLLYDYVK